MQQRRLRLGDILDDYCPRERRITNHAVVAMIEDEVKQTRCTTCDADHEYKQARIPPQRRKRPDGGASDPANSGRLRPVGDEGATPEDLEVTDDQQETDAQFDVSVAPPSSELDMPDDMPPSDESLGDAVDSQPLSDDDGPVHRRLIRATLPRPEGQPPERKEPDFTMRQPGVRDGHKKGPRRGRHGMHAQGQGNTHSPFGGGARSESGRPPRHGSGQGRPGQGGGSRPGSGQGQRPPGNRTGPSGAPRGNRPPGAGRGGRKRGR